MAIFGKLARYQNFGLLIMRIGLGAMMILHGKDKLFGGVATWTDLGHAMGNYIYTFGLPSGALCVPLRRP